jgi:hypothetical protein
MSWRWLIDVRDASPKIDWLRLAIVLLIAEVLAGLLAWFLARRLGPLAMVLIMLPIAGVLIAVDVQSRRRDDHDA